MISEAKAAGQYRHEDMGRNYDQPIHAASGSLATV
jgi:hypothetical protein